MPQVQLCETGPPRKISRSLPPSLTRFESEQPRRGPLVRPRRLREDGVRAVASRETRRRRRR